MPRVLAQLICALAILLSSTVLQSANAPLFSVTLEAPKGALRPGAKVVLRVTLINTSDHNIPFKRTNNPQSNEEFRYVVDVEDSSGKPAPASAQVRALEGQITMLEDINNHAYWLKPGESYSDDLEITKLFDLSHPGEYKVWVSKELLSRHPRPEDTVKSNAVTVVVQP
jgi:hypothetical protein